MSSFKKAERKKQKVRLGLCGASGSGKTMSALKVAMGLGGTICLIDTEYGSGELYSDVCDYDHATIEAPFTVKKYIDLVREAEIAGYNNIIIDSGTHAWAGEGGLLDQKEKAAKSGRGNDFTAWRDVTPLHNQFIEMMLKSPANIIMTLRSKVEYVIEENDKGKKVPKKVGMKPIQREGLDYEFTVVFDIDQSSHFATTSKDRTNVFDSFCDKLSVVHGKMIKDWLEDAPDAPVVESKPDQQAPVDEKKAAPKQQEVDAPESDEYKGFCSDLKEFCHDIPALDAWYKNNADRVKALTKPEIAKFRVFYGEHKKSIS